nr:DUF4229 domain-containing protein [Ornithinimicrobium cryptoxanthini]
MDGAQGDLAGGRRLRLHHDQLRRGQPVLRRLALLLGGLRVVFKYTVYRLGLFLVALLVLLLVDLQPLWAVVIAGLFSMVTSLFLLRGPREEAARNIEERVAASRARRAEKVASERTDEDDEDAEIDQR